MERFKDQEQLNEFLGFFKRKKKVEFENRPQSEVKKSHQGGRYGGDYDKRHRNMDGEVSTMHTDTLHTAYNKLRNTKGSSNSARYKELESERERRGFKPRNHADFWDNYQKIKPKARIHWTDAKGNKFSGG